MLSLNVIRSNDEILSPNYIQNTNEHLHTNDILRLSKLIPSPPQIVIKSDYGKLYGMFDLFMKNSQLIRFGTNEKVVTWRLVNLFNQSTGQSISFNHTFPKLIGRFMENNPQHGITKKSRHEGTIYMGIGLASDDVAQVRGTFIKDKTTIKADNKRRNDQRAVYKTQLMSQLRDEICRRTQWTHLQYQTIVNMGFISMIKTIQGTPMNLLAYDIDAMQKIAEANIITHIYNKIHDLNGLVKHANTVKTAFEQAITQDEYLSRLNEFPTYTNRLRVAPDAHNIGKLLADKIRSYSSSVNGLPMINHITYPDTEHLESLSRLLRSYSPHKVQMDMAVKQENADTEIEYTKWNLENIVHDHSEINTVYVENTN